MSDLSPLVIVGGAGRMGAFFADLFRSEGITVHSVEIDTNENDRKRLLAAAQCVIVSVPISATVAAIEQILPLLSSVALLADFTSIKEPAINAMREHAGEVLGLHPMFAPTKSGISGQTIVICRERAGNRAEALCRIFTKHSAKLLELSASEHDKLMAVVQGMNHFHSIVFAHALKKLGVAVDDTIAVASPVYELQMQLMGRILAQDPQLYIDIQLLNPHITEALKAFQNSSKLFFDAISKGSEAECRQFFSEAASALGSYSAAALAQSDSLLSYIAAKKHS